MKSILKHALVIALLLVCSTFARAQVFSADSAAVKFNTFSQWCSPEKLYLHLDRTYYASDETIWFKGYLSNASEHSLLPASNYIYVELLNEKGDAVKRVKVRRNDDGFSGNLYIPESLKTGYYTLRAYTLWQLNCDQEYMFNQRVKILGGDPFKEDAKAEKKSNLDVTFYPEGGRYFAGAPSNIGFKAMDSDGKSVELTGNICDAAGNSVLPVTTIRDGMGRIAFVPIPGEKYSLVTDAGKYPLPDAAVDGATINVRRNSNGLVVSVVGVPGGVYSLVASNKSQIAKLADVAVDIKPKYFQIGEDFFPAGINHLSLVDRAGRIVSERLLFRYSQSPVCTVSSTAVAPAARELINASLTLSDPSGAPLEGNCSVSVVRGSFKGHLQDDGIVSYNLLSSELKGHINDPRYYFDETHPLRERSGNMDLLMIIQGWRYYDVPSMVAPGNVQFKLNSVKEYWQSIRGKISAAVANKVPKNFIFSVVIPRFHFNKFMSVDQASSFLIDSLDFEENTEFLVSVTRSGLGREYAPRWSGDTYAPSFKYFPAPGIAGAKPEEEKVPLVTEVVSVDTLNAAVVSAKKRDDAFYSLMSGREVSDSDLSAYKNFTLIEYLVSHTPQFEFDGENMYNKNVRRNGADGGGDEETNMAAELMAGGEDLDGVVKLIVDNTETVWWTYEYVRVEEIESINISTQPESFFNAPGGAVILKLKEGAVLDDVSTRASFLYFIPLGYQKAKAFYSPRYDLGDAREGFDHRNTIFWNPSLKVSGGKASFKFCNTDQMDYPYIVCVEGVTDKGVPFSSRTIFNYKERL